MVIIVVTRFDGSHGSWVLFLCLFVCLSVCLSVCLFFHTMSQKLMQLRSPNVTLNCCTMSPENPFIVAHSKGQKVKVTAYVLVFRQNTILPLLRM